MKRWEVVKGMQEGKFVKGDIFKVWYIDGTYFAKINHHGCLVWITDYKAEDELDLVHIASTSEDFWYLYSSEKG